MNAMNKKRGLAGMVAVLFLGLAVLLLSACSDEMEVQQSYPFTLRMDDGMVLLPNDRYPLDREVFRLYYTSECEDQQTIDIYFEDNSEPTQFCRLTFDFNNETEEKDTIIPIGPIIPIEPIGPIVPIGGKQLPVTINSH